MKYLPGPGAMGLLGALFVVPAVLAGYVVGAGWLQIPLAFVFWWFALWLFLGGSKNSRDEGLGWTLIMSMFFSWIGVPIVAGILRALDLPYRFF